MLEVGDSQPWQRDAVDMDQFSACDEVLSETRLREETSLSLVLNKHVLSQCHVMDRTRLSRLYFSTLADANIYVFLSNIKISKAQLRETVNHIQTSSVGMKAADIADEGKRGVFPQMMLTKHN